MEQGTLPPIFKEVAMTAYNSLARKILIKGALPTLLALTACGGPHSEESRAASTNQVESAPFSMISFGDSISSGIFADTQLGDTLTSAQEARIFRMLFTLRDFSVSRRDGNLAFQREAGAESRTAFTGDFPYSHKQRLRSKLGTTVVAHNVALTGSTARELSLQIDEAEGFYRAEQPANYITITLGSNDYCDNITAETFRQNIRPLFERIRRLHPHAGILVVPIPNIVSLLTREYSIGFRAFDTDIACKDLREIEGICARRALSTASSESVRSRALEALRQFNLVLEEETLRMNREEGRAVFARTTALENDIDPELLAVDCYHPGKKGQEALANETWRFVSRLNLRQ
jgi:hypothetical protein